MQHVHGPERSEDTPVVLMQPYKAEATGIAAGLVRVNVAFGFEDALTRCAASSHLEPSAFSVSR